jgi:small-conductance mechanosensitive channel
VPFRAFTGFLLVFVIAEMAGLDSATAQQAYRPFSKVVETWNHSLDRTAQEIAGVALTALRAKALKDRLNKIEAEAREIKTKARAEIVPIRYQLEALGPQPEEGAPPEAEVIVALRESIAKDIAFHEIRVKQADLAIARVVELVQQIAARSLESSIERLAKRYPFPLAPDTLAVAVPDSLRFLAQLGRSPLDWWDSLEVAQKERVVFTRFALVVLLALVFGWGLRRALLRRLGRDSTIEAPSYTRRLTGAIANGVADGLIPSLILAGFLLRALSEDALISGLFAQVFIHFCAVAILFVLAWALPRAVLAPELPAWRLVPVARDNARKITRRITLLAAVVAVDLFLTGSSRELAFSDELASLYTLIAKTVVAVVILTLIRDHLWVREAAADSTAASTADTTPPAPETPRRWRFWPTLRRLIGLIAVAAIATAFAGYASASTYLADNLVISGMVVATLVLLRGLLRETIGVALRSQAVQAALAIPHKARERYKFWLRALLDLTVLLGGFVMVLIVWGVAPRDIWAWTGKTWRGATIGNVTISLGDILVAIVVFVVVLTLTRMIRRLLNERIFPQTGLDTGVRNSLSTGLGYVGLTIALALAVTTIGFDLSNLAIIAGALSVGIGFGLQNVVNNFVSGLILLVERPIKVGDWIEVGAHEGYVRRIDVRATEIETFRRAAVIVPNSELISGAVINWTHKNRYGRVELPIGVAYGSDVAQVMEILQRCLKENESILRMPEPYVLFTGFGDSSLDFEARGQISNVEYRISVQSDLRIAIYLAFEEAGIEIPFPQRDLHIKNVENTDEGFRARAAQPTPQAPTTARVRTDPGGDGE